MINMVGNNIHSHMKAIIPAAGMGTRFLPATKAQPKEMLPIVDKPSLQYVVEEAIEADLNDLLVVTGRNKRAIADHFDRCLELESHLKGESNKGLEEIEQILKSNGATPTPHPDFSEFGMGWGNSFGHREHMMQVRMWLLDRKFGYFIETGVEVLPVVTRAMRALNNEMSEEGLLGALIKILAPLACFLNLST